MEPLNDPGRAALPPSGVEGPTPPAVVKPAPLPPPAYTVTGIIEGDREIAVLRGGEGGQERLFVKVGSTVGNGYVVTDIDKNKVVIKGQAGRKTFQLGEDSRAN